MKSYLLTDDVLAKAKKYQENIFSTDLTNKPNYTVLSSSDRYFVGYVGEYGFEMFLKENGITYDHEIRDDGKIDKGDFIIEKNIFDVKTASQSFHRQIMIPQKQIIKHHRDFYIGARINNKNIEIFGFIERKEIINIKAKDFGYNIPTISLPLLELIPIEELPKKILALKKESAILKE